MHVAVGRLELRLPMSRSLKDRRQAAKSLVSRVHTRFNAAVSEEGGDNRRQGLTLVVAIVSNDPEKARALLQDVAAFVEESRPDLIVLGMSTEILSGV